MSLPFPSANSVFVVGRLTKHSIGADGAHVDLVLEIADGAAVSVRIADKILAAAIEPAVEKNALIQISGALPPSGSSFQVVVRHARGHDVSIIGNASDTAAKGLSRPDTGAVDLPSADAESEPKAPEASGSRPATGLRRPAGLGMGRGNGAPAASTPSRPTEEARQPSAKPAGGFLRRQSRGPAPDPEPAAPVRDDATSDGGGYTPQLNHPNSSGGSNFRRNEPSFGPSDRDSDIPF